MSRVPDHVVLRVAAEMQRDHGHQASAAAMRQAKTYQKEEMPFEYDFWIRVWEQITGGTAARTMGRRKREGTTYYDKLIKEFGVTDDAGCGFYILPNGRFLDGSEGGGSRTADHRAINVVFARNVDYEKRWGSRHGGMMHLMSKTGLIRWMPEQAYLEFATEPTRDQARTIADLSTYKKLELEAGRSTTKGKDLEPDEIISWVKRALWSGRFGTPIGDIRSEYQDNPGRPRRRRRRR
jgi:hypothetical protein